MKSTRSTGRTGRRLRRLPLTAAICLAVSGTAFAQEATPAQDAAAPPTPAPAAPAQPQERTATLETITVTAQKRVENLQKVPISIQVLGQEKLEQMNVADFDDYAKLLPSLAFDPGEAGVGAVPYMRGVASGENSNHSASLPSVGVYLDEQPVTTIGGVLDVHIYDIARVEALAGPQGTLYGASSQSGTLRIISNKPDPSGISGGYALEANTVAQGGNGYLAEGFFNAPLGEIAALRVVAWDKKDAGYIDNRFGTRTFAGWDEFSGGNGTMDNAAFAKDDYNDVRTKGARAALLVELGDNWTITPAVMTQKQEVNGNFASDPVVGELAIRKFFPEFQDDRWTQAALTVQGKVGNFDLTYAYAHLTRDIDSAADYSDYSFWYDAYYQNYYASQGLENTAAEFFVDDNGNPINPSQYILGKDGFTKRSHELRLASPQDWRLRFLVGAFWQQQSHDIVQDYRINGLATDVSVTYWPGTLWLTNQVRQDHDEALFGEVSFDFTDKLTGTAGARFFSYENSLKGFYGFSANTSDTLGESQCFSPERFHGAPCVDLDKTVSKHDWIGRLNLTYQIDDTRMVYGTWSEGFRPGGINRNGTVPPYLPDYLTNWELGWKTTWDDNRLSFNGALFQEKWEDMQFSFLPPSGNGLTVVRNAGAARVRGLETDVSWAATYNLRLGGGFAWYDAKLTENYCGFNDLAGNPVTNCPPGTINPNDPTDPDDDEAVDGPQAPSGTRLPVTPRFKGNLIGRYTFDVGPMEAYLQGAVVYVGNRRSALIDADAAELGDLAAYTTLDLSAGIRKDNWAIDLYIKNATDERAELTKFTQCAFACVLDDLVPEYPTGQVYTITNQPRTIGIRFSQNF